MGVGPDYEPVESGGGLLNGIVDKIMFVFFGLAGSILGSASAAASAVTIAFRNKALHTNPDVTLTPSEVAVALVKNAFDPGELVDEARTSGISPERLEVMRKITGNPPGPESLLDQWRRGLIDDVTFVHGLRSGFLHDEWVGFYRNLRHIPLSPGAYLQGAVEGHIDLGAAIAKVDTLGMSEADATLVYETLGNPPGVHEMGVLWKRGFITRDQLVEAIKESHYKNKYIDPLIDSFTYFPPPRTITTLLAHAALTPAQAQDYFQKAGLTPELAAAYVASALHVKTATHKELSASTVTQLFEDGLISRQQAIQDLAKINYEVAEANLLLDLADAKAKQKIRTEAINGIQALYKAFKIDDATARSDLTKVGVDGKQIDDLLQLWQITRALPSKTLTVAQLQHAYKENLITRAQFITRAVQIGYVLDDAEILASLVVDIRTDAQRKAAAPHTA